MTHALYRASLPQFLADVGGSTLVNVLMEGASRLSLIAVSDQEATSWRNSLPALAAVLDREDFVGAEIFVELFMPGSSTRCDALITGRTPAGHDSAVLVELKQWSHAADGPYHEHVTVGGSLKLHPCAQARDYMTHLQNFHSAFSAEGAAPFDLSACAFLHNLRDVRTLARLCDPARYGVLITEVPLFAANDEARFADWLAVRLLPGPGSAAADRVSLGRTLPSPKLLDLLNDTIQQNREWTLLDEQRTAFFAIESAVHDARNRKEAGLDGRKVIVVRGGPGSGKSVLAIQLLALGARHRWRIGHATGSKAFQTVLQGKTIAFSTDFLKDLYGVRHKNRLPLQNLFATFAEVAKYGADPASAKDPLDLVVADEAHRLWEHRIQKAPSGTVLWRSETPMLEEFFRASLVCAFFLDDNQSVRPGEIGRAEVIEQEAARLGIPCEVIDLRLQFRCSGSQSFINWVDGLFGFQDTNDLRWRQYGAYDLKVVESMSDVGDKLQRWHREGLTCRVVAGYCWRWSKPTGTGALVHDVHDERFGGWSGPWIEKTGRSLKPLDHQYYKWATDPNYRDQVGSIYSAQGFEFDRIILIWGEDLVWRTDRWVAQLQQNRDGTFKRDLRETGADPVAKLKNIYRVLMTRGMLGTEVFIMDPETRVHVQERLAMTKLVYGTR